MTDTATRIDQYLLALYVEQQRRSPPIPSGRLADRLDKSPAATTEMCQRLDSKGLITYEPYEGATLTAEGRSRAADLHERYVTLSWFFRDVLDLDDHETGAMRLAGSVSPDTAARLAFLLLADDAPTASESSP
ncbi:metal-dependent transcriptional regulator [Halorientalis regularis]|uniref:Iron (Metal) dependent repressor, DtxR family n=1 Tax=Halorientalis regularis TaxID=660518 RepID=A0A1G7R7W3_9EURY|nr:metal-dependent transcriptional regulator [Halorientalis regularis]SDG06269.1 iron (metal) dependent repressor, DtxR family [Halorientalis regularis]